MHYDIIYANKSLARYIHPNMNTLLARPFMAGYFRLPFLLVYMVFNICLPYMQTRND